MTKAISDLLIHALNRRDIAPHIQREVINAVFGPGAGRKAMPKLDWNAMRAPLQAHINSMRGNRKSGHPALAELRTKYYDLLLLANRTITAQNHNEPLPRTHTRWQEWIPQEERLSLAAAFKDAYAASDVGQGSRMIPFAPNSLRQENKARIRKLRIDIKTVRGPIPRDETGKTPRILDALLLCACRQAERALDAYEKALASGELHPYEAPAKVNWRHYCEPEMRERIRTYYAKGFASAEGLSSFFDPSADMTRPWVELNSKPRTLFPNPQHWSEEAGKEAE